MPVTDPAQPPDELAARRTAKATPPHDLDTERALLGAALTNPQAADTVADLHPAAFYSPAHAHIADAIRDLAAAGTPVDHFTVLDRLKARQLLDGGGGIQTLIDIAAAGGIPSSATAYARIIVRHAECRTVIGWAGEAALAAYSGNVDTARAHLEAALDTPDTAGDATASIGELADDHMALLDARMRGDTTATPTGLADIDRLIGGLRNGELYVVAGRPGMGKSAMGGQLALNVARNGTRVLFVTIEMSTVELIDRWLANMADVDLGRIHRGDLDEPQAARIGHALDELEELPIDIVDQANVDLATIRANARARHAQVIVIDYLQLVAAVGRVSKREEEVAEVARGAKNLARALDVPVVALAQLNRGVESRQDKRPGLADLRDSGEIENSAGIVLGLYRHDYYHPGSQMHRGEVEAIVLKNRHGAQGTAHLLFRGHLQRIANLDRHHHSTGAR